MNNKEILPDFDSLFLSFEEKNSLVQKLLAENHKLLEKLNKKNENREWKEYIEYLLAELLAEKKRSTNYEKYNKILKKLIEIVVGKKELKFSEKQREDLHKDEEFMKNMNEKAKSAVCIESDYSIGSGFFIGESEDFVYLATNRHIIFNNKKNFVKIKNISFQDYNLEMKKYDSIEIVKSDRTDFGIIKIPKEDILYPNKAWDNYKFPILEINSSRVKRRSILTLIGNNLGEGLTMSFGVSLEKNSSILQSIVDFITHKRTNVPYKDIMSVDCIGYEGSSGGSLIDKEGSCAGINFGGIHKYDEYEFFIPSDILIKEIENLKKQYPETLVDMKIKIFSPSEKIDINENSISEVINPNAIKN